MAADPKNTPKPGEPSRAQLMRVLIPAGAVAVIVILVAVIASISGSGGKKMSDGSDGSETDPGLKEVSAGVKVRDLKEGEGETCPPGSKVKVHYTGWLTDGTVFDTSKKKGEPIVFSLDGVIAGWTQGIPGMKKGGVRKLVISAEKGYGARGSPPSIPPGSTLIFEVELLDFTPPAAPPRPRRSPAPTDLTKLFDGSMPGADDPNLKTLGNEGLKFRDLKEGDGPVVSAGATVVVDYIGWLTNGSMFDSSWKPDREPFPADLTPGSPRGVIPGWQQGMVGMKVGGIRKLVIPPALAYGPEGRPGSIPPNATLVFQVELLGTK